jgi:hypothetical protein
MPPSSASSRRARQVLVCTRCQRRSTCFDPCWDVSVQLPRASSCTLEQCLDAYVKEETLSGMDGIYCARCKKLTTQRKALRFSRMPRIFVVHLKRFEQHRKLQNDVRVACDWVAVPRGPHPLRPNYGRLPPIVCDAPIDRRWAGVRLRPRPRSHGRDDGLRSAFRWTALC